MVWPEVSIEDFPPRRDDEPASLRQDILDELTDHFVCAFNRELLKNSDERLAQKRVIKKFGDPVKIARQLWFDAMKERIMSQRIMTGISAVMAVCSIAVVGIAWILMRDSQLVNRQMLDQLAVIADRPQADSTVVKSLQSTNEAIVRELKVLADSQRPSRPVNELGMSGMMGAMGVGEGEMMGGGFGMESKPAEPSNINQQILKQLEQLNQKQNNQESSASEGMNQISFQLVQDNKDKKPAVGFKGILTKNGNQMESFSLESVSTKTGKLDFGKLPWGQYYFYLNAPWGEVCHVPSITVIPGRDYTQTIVCPVASPLEVPVQFKVNWSTKQNSEDWYLLCDFRELVHVGYGHVLRETANGFSFNSTRKLGDDLWTTIQNQQQQPKGVYLISSDDQVSLCPLDRKGYYENIGPDSLAEKTSINILQGQYTLPLIYLIPKKYLNKLSSLNKSASYDVFNSVRKEIVRYDPYHSESRGMKSGTFGVLNTAILIPSLNITDPMLNDSFGNSKNVAGIQLPRRLEFTASKDQTNLWEIELPDLSSLTSKIDSSKNVR
ncbi:DUF1700 domain-containing protein [Gimesia aquarii]|uniref:Uncharacterized protein n=1 Tax=Gimesia aquarii TaxID=2527964 RepID=A0A517VT41_9PLAN|nr:hypothetical protein [Gimesia aquarii]QDT96184.1 hypothetical protein V144x_16370 [Gimesia aquarii]